MYLSSLLIDTGENPDRPRPGRLWLRNVYHVHQRLCMAFPSEERRSDDPDFLEPYSPDDFAGQVHVARGDEAGFLFRIDPHPGGSAVILVQSAAQPDWEYAFHNAGYLLAAPPEAKPFEPRADAGQRLRFRLLANPTRRLSKNSPGADGSPVPEKEVGKRVPVRDDNLLDWLVRRTEAWGVVDNEKTTIQPGYVYFEKKRGGGQRLRSVRYDGVLTVNDPDGLVTAVGRGIGSGKGLGFGLLSVAPLR